MLPALSWIKSAHPHWNASVRDGVARHVMVSAHEEGWAEVWRYLVEWLRDVKGGDHSNELRRWDDIHPASRTRQLAVLQFSGNSDFVKPGAPPRHRCVSQKAPCYICFQPGKDVVVPAAPGLVDYPRDDTCDRLSQVHLPTSFLPTSFLPTSVLPTAGSFHGSGASPAAASLPPPPSHDLATISPRRHSPRHDLVSASGPATASAAGRFRGRRLRVRHHSASVHPPKRDGARVFFSGAIWTRPRGAGFYEASRLVLYRCHKKVMW